MKMMLMLIYWECILYIIYTQQVGGAAQHGQEGQPEEEECPHAQYHGHFLRTGFGNAQTHTQYHGHFLDMVVDRKANEKKKNLLMLSTMATIWRLDLFMDVETMIFQSEYWDITKPLHPARVSNTRRMLILGGGESEKFSWLLSKTDL